MAFRSYLALILTMLVSCTAQETSTTSTADSKSVDSLSVSRSRLTKTIQSPQISRYVVDVFEDSRGHLWMGTMDDGVARWDGDTLIYYGPDDGLCGKTISSIKEDANGTLWFSGHTGTCTYDGREFETLQTTSGRHDDEIGWVHTTHDSKGNVWTSSNRGIFMEDGRQEIEIILPTKEKVITEFAIHPGRASLALDDSKGNLWFRTDGDGAYRYDGENFTHFSKSNGLCSNVVNSIVEDKRGDIWFLCMQASTPRETGDGGLCRYDPSISSEPSMVSIRQFPQMDGLHHVDLYSILLDTEGDIWIGANGLGVYRYDGERFHLFEGTDRMDLTARMGIQDILEDSQGQMWFGMSGGLFRLIDDRIVNVTQDGPWK